jgi:maleamate amidohydrolase
LVRITRPSSPGFIQEWMRDYFGSEVELSPKLLGFGKSPALLIVDMMNAEGSNDMVERATKNIATILDKAREKRIPIFYTVIEYREDLKDFIPLKLGTIRKHLAGSRYSQVMDALKPRSEIVIKKKVNSAFIGTNLLAYLVGAAVDTVIITGIHTSGCVRATASDSFSYGFKTVIPEECVADIKGDNPHRANLCDLHIRGADVVNLSEVLGYLERIRDVKAADKPR